MAEALFVLAHLVVAVLLIAGTWQLLAALALHLLRRWHRRAEARSVYAAAHSGTTARPTRAPLARPQSPKRGAGRGGAVAAGSVCSSARASVTPRAS